MNNVSTAPRTDDASDVWVLATHNAGKVREFQELLAPLAIRIVTAGDYGLVEPEETGLTFEENAILKAEAACQASGKISLADDSGLCVTALGGDPGIYSARWAGEKKDFASAMARVAASLKDTGVEVTGAAAYFVCVLAVAQVGKPTLTFRGEVHGTLIYPPRGERGFGYDPMFIANGHTRTFGEMEPVEKHAISHRADAFRKFSEWLKARAKE
jgi:XTP/dITP diphosphohydrolase